MLQRACDLKLFDTEILKESVQRIHNALIQKGVKISNGRRYLSESYETEDVDASGLLAFTSGFLSEDLAGGTREEIEKHLAQEGNIKRAEALLASILEHTSPLGLDAEQIDPEPGEFMGNFPQGFSHLGLIMTILNLERAKKNSQYSMLPDHKKFDRSGYAVGWKGILSGFPRTRILFHFYGPVDQNGWIETCIVSTT